MKRGLAVCLTLSLLIALVVAAPVSAQRPVEIQFWHAMSGLLGQTIDDLVAEFNAAHPDIEVNVEYKGSYRDTLNATIAASRAGNAPHVVQSFEIATQQLIDMGLFVPLEDAFPPGVVDWDAFLGPVVNYYRIGGTLYSMPFNSSNPILYYNKDLFREAGLDPERPPATFEEVVEYSRQIKDSGAAAGGITLPLHAWFFEQWMANMGQDLVDNQNGRVGRATTAHLDSDAATTILSWWKQLFDEGLYLNPGVENWQQSRQLFAAGRVAMAVDSTAALSAKLRTAEEQGFELGTGRLPISADAERHGVIIGGGSLWVTGGHGAAESEAAGEFVRFMSSADIQSRWHKGTGYFPIHEGALDLLDSEGWFEEWPHYKVAMDQLLETRPVTATQGALIGNFPEIRTIITDAVQEVFQDHKTVDQALADAKARAEQAMGEYLRVVGN